MTDGKKAQKLFYSKPIFSKMLNKAKGKQKFVGFYFDNAVEEYNYEYRQLFRLYKDYKSNK